MGNLITKSWPDSLLGDFDDVFGAQAQEGGQVPMPNPLYPFLTGTGNDPGMAWGPQYQAATTYNQFAFPGGDPYGTGQQYNWNSPYPMANWQPGQYFGPGMTPTQQAGGQAPTGGSYQGYGPTSGAAGGPVANGGRAQNGLQYHPTYEGGIYTGADRDNWMPGLFPSASAQFMYGPQQYYPFLDVAGKTLDQQTADNRDRNFVSGAGQDMLGDQRQIANQLANGNYLNNPVQQRTANYAMNMMGDDAGQLAIDKSRQALGAGNLAMNIARNDQGVEFNKDFGRYGLGRFTNGEYTENPYLTQSIDNAASDTNRALGEQILPMLGRDAIAHGQYGGSRQQIAEGIAGRGAAEEIAQQATGARFGDYNEWNNRGLRAGEAQMQGDVAAQQAATQRAQIESQHQLGLLGALTGIMNAGTGAFSAGSNAQIGAGQLGNQSAQQAFNLDSLRQSGMTSGADVLQQVIDGKLDLNAALRDVGSRDQMLNQLFLNSDKNRWDAGQSGGWDNLAKFASILKGAGDPTQQTRNEPSTGAGIGLADILALFDMGT